MSLRHVFTDTGEIHDLYGTFSGTQAWDIGANAGQTANLFADSFETVVACEPSIEPFKYLVEHAKPNVTCLNVAVSAEPGEILLTRREMTDETGYLFTGDSLPEWGDAVEQVAVAATTLRSLARHYGRPDFIKIDTEGHEWKIIQPAADLFRGIPFLIEIHSQANGSLIRDHFDWHDVAYRVVRHASHPHGSLRWESHYWVVNDGR